MFSRKNFCLHYLEEQSQARTCPKSIILQLEQVDTACAYSLRTLMLVSGGIHSRSCDLACAESHHDAPLVFGILLF